MNENTISIPGWKIIRVIGKGGFGCVYEVEKEGVFGSVTHSALKVISIPETEAEVKAYRDDGYDDASLTDLFRTQVEDITAEFELMSKLKGDSHIVSYEDHTIVQHEKDPGYDIFIRMELLTSLPDHINRAYPDNRIPDAAAIKLGADICRALERCGRHNIIHRDIKPQNIFVNEEGDFKLGDFGIAKTSDHTTKATKTGTYGYMAPEVFLSKPYNASVDIYSLGLVLYWLLNERRGPFLPLPPAVPRPSQNSEALDRRMHGEPLPAPKHGSEELKRIVLKACAYDPKDRYASPAELRRDLERAVAAKETETFAPPVKAVEPVSAEADERTVGAYRKETEDDRTVSVVSEPVKANETERPVPVAVQTPVADEIKTPQPKQAYEATVGAFRAETGKNVDTYEDGTVRIAAKPISEAGPAAYAEDADATVGLFAKRPETVKPPVKKAPEPKAKPVTEAEQPKPAPKPEKPAENLKTAGKGSKKTLLIIAAAAALAVIAAVVLIVVLAGKGKPAQQAETDPTAAPAEAPTDAPTAVPTDAPTPTQTQNPTEKPTEKPTPTPTPKPTPTPAAKLTPKPDPVVTFQDAAFEKAFREEYHFSGTIRQSDVLGMTQLYFWHGEFSDITDVAQFKNLRELELYYCEDGNGRIKDISALAELTKLESLSLCAVYVQDFSALKNLTSLKRLEIDNYFAINDYSFLKNKTRLESLNLTHCGIKDLSIVIDQLAKPEALKSLDVDYNPISDLSALRKLDRLEYLYFRYITGEKLSTVSVIVDALKHPEKLKGLVLWDHQIKDISPLSNLTSLTYLDLMNNRISDITALKDLTKLENLTLTGNQISDITVLSGLKELHCLYLGSNQITDITALSGLVKLHILYIDYNPIKDISCLNGLTGLEYLGVKNTKISKNQIEEFQAGHSNCNIEQ